MTRLGTWFWLAIYVVVPSVMVVLGARQLRVSAVDAPRTHPFPRSSAEPSWRRRRC